MTLSDLDYADHVVLVVADVQKAQLMVDTVEAACVGLRLNRSKWVVMSKRVPGEACLVVRSCRLDSVQSFKYPRSGFVGLRAALPGKKTILFACKYYILYTLVVGNGVGQLKQHTLQLCQVAYIEHFYTNYVHILI